MYHYKNKTVNPAVLQDMKDMKSLIIREAGYNPFDGTRKRESVDLRRVFVELMYDKYGLGESSIGPKLVSLKNVGDFMGKDHATVIHLHRNGMFLIERDPELFKIYRKVRTFCNGNLVIRKRGASARKRELLEELAIVNLELQKIEDDYTDRDRWFEEKGFFNEEEDS